MQGVGGRERYFRTGDIGRGPALRARPLCGQPGRPCLDTSVGTSGSGGLFQPGTGTSGFTCQRGILGMRVTKNNLGNLERMMGGQVSS